MVQKKILPIIVIAILPLLLALLMPLFFSMNLFLDPTDPLSIVAMAVLPMLEGALVIMALPIEKVRKPGYRFFMPWLGILLFFAIAFLLHLEDCACWIIGLPIFLLLSSAGGAIDGYLRIRKTVDPAPAE